MNIENVYAIPPILKINEPDKPGHARWTRLVRKSGVAFETPHALVPVACWRAYMDQHGDTDGFMPASWFFGKQVPPDLDPDELISFELT